MNSKYFVPLLAATFLLPQVNPAVAQNWMARVVQPEKNQGTNAFGNYWTLTSVACSTDGTKIIAAGGSLFVGGPVCLSTDLGATWRVASLPTNAYWGGVAASAEGTKMAAVEGRSVYTSSDTGATWTENSAPFSAAGVGSVYCVASSADGVKLVGGFGTIYAYGYPAIGLSSDSGATWVPSFRGSWSAVASSADGNTLAALGIPFGGPPPLLKRLYVSTDAGGSWREANLPSGIITYMALSGDGSTMVACYTNVFTSTDSGNTWKQWADAPHGTFGPIYWTAPAASANGKRLMVGGFGGGFVGTIFTSADSGATWQSTNNAFSGAAGFLAASASSADGRELIAIPKGGAYAFTLQDPLDLTISATPHRAHIGDSIQVVVTVINKDINNITNVSLPGGITVAGRGGVSPAGPAGPALIALLAPGATASFTNLYTATNYGTVNFTAAATYSAAGGAVTGAPATSGNVIIAPNGDLLIKRAEEAVSQFAGGDIYQIVPINPQIKTNAIGTNELSQFQVQIVNHERTPLVLTLEAIESTNPGWSVTYDFSGQDISAQLRSPGGTQFPQLASGDSFEIDIAMTATNAPTGDVKNTQLVLGLASDPSLTLDTVEAISKVVAEIVVNSTADLPNQDPIGCCCDTGNKLADGSPECTLRAAIDLANRRAGQDLIRFAIPSDDSNYRGGNPLIEPLTALPPIVDTVLIDGTSQNQASTVPAIELSGGRIPRPPLRQLSFPLTDILNWPGAANGLLIAADQCEIRGLAINLFPLCGILVKGGGAIIQGNHIGITQGGTVPAANGSPGYRDQNFGDFLSLSGAGIAVQSDFNLIGGTGPRDGNTISGLFKEPADQYQYIVRDLSPPEILVTGGRGNTIAGNLVGLTAAGTGNFIPPPGTAGPLIEPQPAAGIWLRDGASANLIGGASAASRNVIANSKFNIWIEPGCTNNVVSGNFVGTDATGNSIVVYPVARTSNYGSPTELGVGISVSGGNVVGGNSPAEGNQIGGMAEAIGFAYEALGLTTTVNNNYVGVTTSGSPIGNWIGISGVQTMGSRVRNNQVAFNQIGMQFQGSSSQLDLEHNQVYRNGDSGIQFLGDSYSPSFQSTTLIGNTVAQNGGAGIIFKSPSTGTTLLKNTISSNGLSNPFAPGGVMANPGAVRPIILTPPGADMILSQNSIFDNSGLGVSFDASSPPGRIPTFNNTASGVPTYPVLSENPTLTGNQLQFTISQSAGAGAGGDYTIEFFGSPSANQSGYGEGKDFLGSIILPVNALGQGFQNVTLNLSGNPGYFLTATATTPGNGTSEFSQARLIQGGAVAANGLSPGLQNQTPNLAPTNSVNIRQSSRSSSSSVTRGDGNGDGILDSLESNVASFPTIAGVWATLASPNNTALLNVHPGGPPDFTSIPAGFSFPIGFVSFGITNLPANGTVTVTNYLHLWATPSFAYAATTFFNFGPTPDNSAPHWYQFDYDGTTGVELFSDRLVLHLRDGDRGDNDLRVNGQISTTGAPAFQIPLQPALSLEIASVAFSARVSIVSQPNSPVILITNQIPTITSVLSWPSSATNYGLYSRDDLTVASALLATNSFALHNLWVPVPDAATLIQGQNVVTNVGFGGNRFYQLRRF